VSAGGRVRTGGADIIAVDICAQLESVAYPRGTAEGFEETVREVEKRDRRIFAAQADTRDGAALRRAVEEGVAAVGPVDIVLANAGIGAGGAPVSEDREWDEVVGVNRRADQRDPGALRAACRRYRWLSQSRIAERLTSPASSGTANWYGPRRAAG